MGGIISSLGPCGIDTLVIDDMFALVTLGSLAPDTSSFGDNTFSVYLHVGNPEHP